MTINRISTLGQHQRLLSDFGTVQSRLADVQEQISSGFKTRNFEGLNGQVEQFTSVQAKVSRAQQYQDNNELILTRMRSTNTAVDQIIDAADKLANLIQLRRNQASGLDNSFVQQVNALKTVFVSQLNTNLGGRFLFSGTDTSSQAVIDPPPESVELGTPDAGYYQGSTEDMTARAEDGYEFTYNVRADNSAFQKLFAGVFEAIEGHETATDERLRNAYELVRSGLQETISVQADLNAKQVVLEDINEAHEAQQLYFKGIAENISRTDIVAASTQVAVDQGVLTASFQVFARITSLKLSDFLN